MTNKAMNGVISTRKDFNSSQIIAKSLKLDQFV